MIVAVVVTVIVIVVVTVVVTALVTVVETVVMIVVVTVAVTIVEWLSQLRRNLSIFFSELTILCCRMLVSLIQLKFCHFLCMEMSLTSRLKCQRFFYLK